MDDSTEAFQTYRGRVGHMLSLVVASLLRGQQTAACEPTSTRFRRRFSFGRAFSAWCWSASTRKAWRREFLSRWTWSNWCPYTSTRWCEHFRAEKLHDARDDSHPAGLDARRSGCNYTKEHGPRRPVEVPATYSDGGQKSLHRPSARKAEPVRDARWWRQMGDPTLSALIEEALRRNQSVRAGWARVRQARFIANQVRAARMPQIGVDGDYRIGREIQVFGEFSFQNAMRSLPISYEVDLFARRAREHQGAKLDAEAARLDQEALAITISAEVAEAWFDSINARIEVAVVQEQLETDLRFLELVELRYREGLNSAVDVHQQRQRVASQRALLALADAQTDLTDQRLSVLLGEAPGRRFPVDGKALPDIGPTPDIEAPASLLQARPDIQAVQKRVEAEDRRVAAAVGARLPSISLDFTPGYKWLQFTGEDRDPTSRRSGRTSLHANGLVWNAGAQLSVPLFDGIAGWSAIKAQRAVLDQLLSNTPRPFSRA